MAEHASMRLAKSSRMLGEYESRACEFILHYMLKECRESQFDNFPENDRVATELCSFEIDNEDPDYDDCFFYRFIAVEKKPDGQCEFADCRRALPDTDDADSDDGYSIQTDYDNDEDPEIRYFSLRDVLYWSDVYNALRHELEPRGYMPFVIETTCEREGCWDYIKIILVKAPQ